MWLRISPVRFAKWPRRHAVAALSLAMTLLPSGTYAAGCAKLCGW
jgi:hypothetical protein